jgi:hypothetical protein
MLMIDVAGIENGTERWAHERARCIHPAQGAALTRVEPEDLARFEGEGGLEAPETAAPHPEEWNARETKSYGRRHT